MSTVTLPEPAIPPAGESMVWNDVSWDFYENFLNEFQEKRNPHSYVNGELRVMAPSARHENPKRRIGRLVETLTEELDLWCISLGSTTLKRALKDRGAEPDECYLIANAETVTDVDNYNLESDPPPDLVIEIDVTAHSLNRLPVYAALGVPEVWIYDGETLQIGLHRDDEAYDSSETSRAFPTLSIPEFAEWIQKGYESLNESAWIRSFREWVRENVKTE